MADENTTTESGQPSGAGAELEVMMKELNFDSPSAMRAAMTNYRADIATLKDKVKSGEATATELAQLKTAQQEQENKNLSAAELNAKKYDELKKEFDSQQAAMIAEKKSNLLSREISKVTRSASKEEAELFAEFATLKLNSEEFTTQEELQPMLIELADRWERLRQTAQPQAQTVPEGRQVQGAAAGKRKVPANKFNRLLQGWKYGKKG